MARFEILKATSMEMAWYILTDVSEYLIAFMIILLIGHRSVYYDR
jgi:hypothetical protein